MYYILCTLSICLMLLGCSKKENFSKPIEHVIDLNFESGDSYEKIQKCVGKHVCGEREINDDEQINIIFYCADPTNLQNMLPLLGEQLTQVFGGEDANDHCKFYPNAAKYSDIIPLVFVQKKFVGSGWQTYYEYIKSAKNE